MSSFIKLEMLILLNWPRLFKERISPIQRINHYPVDKIYPLAPSRLFERWIALSTRYPADKFIHGKVGSINFSGPARGGSGIPIYPLFCPQDTNIPQNRKMCDTKYLKLFWNRILNTWKWTEFKSVDRPARLLQFANRLVLKPLYFSSYLSVF